MSADEFLQRLRQKGILAGSMSSTCVRMVTNRHITCGDIETVIRSVAEILC